MPRRGDSYHSGVVPEGSGGAGCVLGVVVLSALLAYSFVHTDPTEGLDYSSGNEPEEMKNSPCFSDSGPCPPTGFKWSIPASSAVQTWFERENGDERTKLRGWLRLEAKDFTEKTARDCSTTVDWSLLADNKPIAHGTITTGSDDRRVAGTAPSEARSIVFAARRTDSNICHATLQWIYAGLD